MNWPLDLFFVATASLGSFRRTRASQEFNTPTRVLQNPDAMGAIGPESFRRNIKRDRRHFGSAIFDKCTARWFKASPTPSFSRWQHQGTNVALETLADPRILYGPQAQRGSPATLAQNLEGRRARDQSGQQSVLLGNELDEAYLPFTNTVNRISRPWAFTPMEFICRSSRIRSGFKDNRLCDQKPEVYFTNTLRES